jgi:polyisoprenoid-binding protein YceI
MSTIQGKIGLISLISIFTLSAITLTQSEGTLSGNSGSNNGDVFPVIAQEFNIDISKPINGFRNISVIIPTNGITTENWMRDVHMGMSIFNSDYENIEFTCKTNTLLEMGSYNLVGELKINNVSNPSLLQIEIYNKKNNLFVKGTSTIRLSEYKIEAPGMGTMKVVDEISVNFDLKL